MTKRILLFICLFAISLPAHAISRYNTPSLTCSRIQTILKSENAAILRYPSPRIADLTLYDIYVSHGRYCDYGEYGKTAYVPARDTRQCKVLECKPVSNQDNGR
ncbi:MAG: hypothetical protein GY789_02115 [Hyphomicrobiales bacterium]|nr:hypothetical protein [Hyphomicrobiales bacterium]MCP5000354.1 hypothetical protein [Hyphomicrobiales bacterium]